MRGKKRTHDEYVLELQAINPYLEVIDKYINAKTKIKHKCLKCEYEWDLAPLHSLQGKGCPQCAGVAHKTQEQYKKDVNKINTNIKVIGEYINYHTSIAHQCVLCGFVWDAQPANILSGKSCPKCAIKKNAKAQTKTHLEYLKELNDKNIKIKPLEDYQTNNIKILHKCLLCNFEWKVKPSNVLNRFGCPHCRISKGEYKISTYLSNRNIVFEEQYCFNDCKIKRVMPFDFYLPDYNMCIEYDGEHHFKPTRFGGMSKEIAQNKFYLQQQRDLIKNNYCQENNIKLIRISYIDYDNIENILNEIFSPTTTE